MNFSEKTIKKDTIYNGKIIEVNLHTVRLPNGRESKREIVNHPGGVAILAYKDSDTIFMVEQFRKPIERSILEIPAGKIEKNEDIETCGIRELEEEIGYKAGKFEYIGKVVTSPGFCDEYIYIFKAEDLYKGRDDIGDEDEFIDVKEVKLSRVKDMIKKGEIIDAKTICAFMMV
ncbi:NUDIX hydrolase [Clostridium luticellarii]|jgi:ADP-ribose pyrophosphatase|uniref:ADP-ribose pyrophosphatase n=1 Tax=Clostridium luticellarii TaxID=1691940 RepID=A0A2T0BRM7_9CLOT|nr:NUDIX hydrolase [Clostridium luticellarii]MCI1943764.1 NUDIX hydrolase [Clostridium luticellarii]MCI1967025.1 NUDIX hydrolase [Clostridium luticellarii]MCI1994392.1 NUDIX hydrolase [Clostridium luticellarii]MCI2038655.1 NUDIX hydrolase [Clostridium luticellarii]PRR86530.1 ADP-ribose pyrophosphatase [Clostridium luticellarii]